MNIVEILAKRMEEVKIKNPKFLEVRRKELNALNEFLGGGKMKKGETIFFRGLPCKIKENG